MVATLLILLLVVPPLVMTLVQIATTRYKPEVEPAPVEVRRPVVVALSPARS